jgi:hypothetical protein
MMVEMFQIALISQLKLEAWKAMLNALLQEKELVGSSSKFGPNMALF